MENLRERSYCCGWRNHFCLFGCMSSFLKRNVILLKLSAFLQNFFLHQDRLSGDVPCYLALGQALIWGLYLDWFEGLYNTPNIVAIYYYVWKPSNMAST